MYTVDDLNAALRTLRREIDKYEKTLKTKVRNAKPHVRELYNAQRLCEEAAKELCKENADLRQEIEEQRYRIQALEFEVGDLRSELEEQREENRKTTDDLQGQIDELRALQHNRKNNVDSLMTTLHATLARIENNSKN